LSVESGIGATLTCLDSSGGSIVCRCSPSPIFPHGHNLTFHSQRPRTSTVAQPLHVLFAHYGTTTNFTASDNPVVMEAFIDDKAKALSCKSIRGLGYSLPNVSALADLTNRHGVLLVDDNAFRTCRIVARPLGCGADTVVELVSTACHKNTCPSPMLTAVCSGLEAIAPPSWVSSLAVVASTGGRLKDQPVPGIYYHDWRRW
jgi:hypothetical protein